MCEECVERIGCNKCKWADNAVQGGKCKREFPNIKLAKPVFKSDRFDTLRFCCDFEPKGYCVKLKENWKGFEDWYEQYKRDWDNRPIEGKTVSYTIDGNESVRYQVSLKDFIYGTLFEDGKLKVVTKMYYKKTKGGFGYKLVVDNI